MNTATHEAGEDPCPCWCCGQPQDPARVVPLGLHPEVMLCVGCAHLASKRASAIEDQHRTGAAVHVREVLRGVRELVVSRGWHEHRVFGPLLRWLGRHTP